MSERHEDWQRRFWSAMEAEAAHPFEWGVRDCALFGARIADATLVSPYVEMLTRATFKWSTAREAAALLKDRSLRELTESVLGTSTAWPCLQMGDLVLCHYEDADGIFDSMLAVHDGVHPIAFHGGGKLVTQQWRTAICGWSV